MAKVFILRGKPGSGKSSLIKKLTEGYFRPIICSADDYHMVEGEYRFSLANAGAAHNACFLKFMEALEDFTCDCVVVDNTNLAAFEYAPYYRVAEVFGRDVEIITIECPLDVCKARNVHSVPAATIDRMEATMLLGTQQMPKWWNHIVVPAWMPEEEKVA